MHQAANAIKENLIFSDTKIQNLADIPIEWRESFEKCREELDENILVLAIENSYAGTLYENLYKFLGHNAKIIGEYAFPIHHCLCSKENKKENIKKVYSHYKALPQCYNYLKKNNMEGVVYFDTALSAKMVSESKETGIASISSSLACEMYGLNIVEENIEDQDWNTTRFLVIVPKKSNVKYRKKAWKVSIIFEAQDIPASLYTCLWVFAENGINLKKIESLPNPETPFSYLFWLDFEGNLSEQKIKIALKKLEKYTHFIKILWEY